MRTVTRIGGSNGDRFLDLSDYERVLGSICEEKGWEYETFRDYIFFDKECFNIENRKILRVIWKAESFRSANLMSTL